jgi:hypothetical protein
MKDLLVLSIIAMAAITAVELCQTQPSNLPPAVTITWPNRNCGANYIFSQPSLKIKAEASDPDGSIVQVQFFANTNLIGVVSNAPYTVTWGRTASVGGWDLKAVAVDNLGGISESDTISVVIVTFPTAPVFAISPLNGLVLAVPASFEFAADLLAAPYGQTGTVEFFVGTNLVGTVTQTETFTNTTPPYVVAVTNIPEGDYVLSVKKNGAGVNYAACKPTIIHVAKLGIQSPRLASSNRFTFDVVTSFPTNQNVIEASSNLLNWTAISTNVPMTNTFTFTDPSPATNSPRFYRAVVSSQ